MTRQCPDLQFQKQEWSASCPNSQHVRVVQTLRIEGNPRSAKLPIRMPPVNAARLTSFCRMPTLRGWIMKSGFFRIFPASCLVVFLAVRSFAADTNSLSSPTNADAVANGYLQIQMQLARHATGAGKKPRGGPAKRRGHDHAHPGARTNHRRATRRRPRSGAEKPAVHVHAVGRVRADGAGGGAVHGLSPMALGGAAGGNGVAPGRRAGVRRGRPAACRAGPRGGGNFQRAAARHRRLAGEKNPRT